MVELFFVISGIVFTHVYQRGIAEGAVSGRRFALARFARLYPLYLFTLLYVTGFVVWRAAMGLPPFVYEANTPGNFLLNLALLHDGLFTFPAAFNGPSWSIAVEAVCYALFYAANAWAPAWRWACYGGLIGYGALLLLAGWPEGGVPLANFNMARGLVAFFSGCVLYESMIAERRALRMVKFAFPAMCVLIAVGYLLHTPLKDGVPVHTVPGGKLTYSLVVFPTLMFAVLHLPLLDRLLARRPFAVAGDISYSVYLLHFPLQITIVTAAEMAGIALDFRSPVFLALYAGALIAAGCLSYYRFERPVARLIRRRGAGWVARAAVAPRMAGR
jgi:peptidoglycan/LPS O-acetylase OafA/YrhL